MINNENYYNCVGICTDPPMFYFNKDVTSGLPASSCQSQIKKDLKWGYLLYGSIFMFAGLCLFIAFNVQYGMWGRNLYKRMQKRGKKHDESDDEKPKKPKKINVK